MKIRTIAVMALVLSGCGAATPDLGPDGLAITARDAFNEARATARGWDARARLRYVEGLGVSATGQVRPDQGEWRFHYTATGQSSALMVRVAPLGLETQEQAPTSPPGYVLGDNALGASGWVDSPEALATVLEAQGGGDGAAEMILVPTVPARWVVRFPDAGSQRWVVNAETGALMTDGGA